MESFENLPKQEQERILHPLLNYLSHTKHSVKRWQDWILTPCSTGTNNLVYRVTNPKYELAIKFTIRCERNRAVREYTALMAMKQAGMNIAPKPILIDKSNYTQPVVVQTWFEGKICTIPPTTSTGWKSLLKHYATIRAITPDKISVQLSEAFFNASSVESSKNMVRQQFHSIPPEARPDSLKALVSKFELLQFPEWPEASVSLCKGDANIKNFISTASLWGSVDWEYSGWGDPAFDIAELMTHITNIKAALPRQDWIIEYYCNLVNEPTAEKRIRIYCKIMLFWWAVHLIRRLSEIQQGIDKRLVKESAYGKIDLLTKYEYYLGLIKELI